MPKPAKKKNLTKKNLKKNNNTKKVANVTNKNKAAVFNKSHLNWGKTMNANVEVKMRARTAAQKAANNAANLLLKTELKAIRNARLASERERAVAEAVAKRAKEIATAHVQWARENAAERANAEKEFTNAGLTNVPPRPRVGKVMKECRTNNAAHLMPSGVPCKFVHKDEPEYAMLRPDQRRVGGGRNVYVAPSPSPLSKVNTYTSWPGGIDPTAPLYNQRTMLGGRRTRRN